MENKNAYYQIRKEFRISIKRILPNLKRLKKETDKPEFYDLLSEAMPNLRSYIIKRIKTATIKNHFPKNKYNPDEFIDQLFIEIYNHIENFSDEDEFYIWLYKKTNNLLEDAINEEEFDDLFFKNIDDYSKQEWDEMEENFTAENDGDLIMQEELSDISYHQNPFTIQDVFIENTENELIKQIDKNLHQEEVDRQLQFVLHNLPSQTQNVFELYTKHHLTIAEIAKVKNISINHTKQLLEDSRKLLKTSLFNRYTLN